MHPASTHQGIKGNSSCTHELTAAVHWTSCIQDDSSCTGGLQGNNKFSCLFAGPVTLKYCVTCTSDIMNEDSHVHLLIFRLLPCGHRSKQQKTEDPLLRSRIVMWILTACPSLQTCLMLRMSTVAYKRGRVDCQMRMEVYHKQHAVSVLGTITVAQQRYHISG